MARDPDRARKKGAPTVTNSFVVCLVHLVSLVYPVSLVQPNKPDKLDRPDKPERLDRLKVPCLDHIIEAVDVEPVPCRIEDADGILPFQQFLEQLGNAGLTVGWLG